jgi:excisionase family DNA binding protein
MSSHIEKQGAVLPLEKLLTEDDVAGLLNVSLRHVRNLRARRLIPFVRLGRSIRFPVHSVQDALKKLTVEARA